MVYKIKQVEYVDVEVDPADLLGISEAAGILGMTIPGIIRAIDRGALSEYVDESVVNYRGGRRFVLRSDVERLASERQAAGRS